MASYFVGEIRLFGGNFAPVGWMFCNGQLLPISENETLFNLIGTTYGGDGQETFALPNLQGRAPMHEGNGHTLAETGGVESVTLTTNQIPSHAHNVVASSQSGTVSSPSGAVFAQPTSGIKPYRIGTPTAAMAPQMISSSGGSQPHDNMQPYLAVQYIISLFGIFPTQN